VRVVLVIALLGALPAFAAQEAKRGCVAVNSSSSEADLAYGIGMFSEAETLYKAMLVADHNAVSATAGLVRTTIKEGRIPEALGLALTYEAANPGSALAMELVGEAHFRLGEMDDAAIALNKAARMDPCLGRTHFIFALYQKLAGNNRSAMRELDLAHSLSPEDPEVDVRWHSDHSILRAIEEQNTIVEQYRQQLRDPSLTPQERAMYLNLLEAVDHKDSCRIVSPTNSATLHLVPIRSSFPSQTQATAIDVLLNTNLQRLKVDTGISGVMVSRDAASAAGLKPGIETTIFGIGDKGSAQAFTAQAASIKIGNFQLQDCLVEIIQDPAALPNGTGLIGMDIFNNYVITLDFPRQELRLQPLPLRPDDQDGSLPTDEVNLHDAYVSSEMKGWTRIFRSGHNLLIPTNVNNMRNSLFVLDTGSMQNVIAPYLAADVTSLFSPQDIEVRGIGGDVTKLLAASKVMITFAGVKQQVKGMTAIDVTSVFRNLDVRVDGAVGYSALRFVILSIDYRDNLIHVEYKPK
jgi:tetratricopeptide (TPR) repeat protein